MMLADPEGVRLLVATGGKLPMARFRVESESVIVVIGVATVPIEPATEVRLRRLLVRRMELVTPPPLRMAFAATVPPFTVKMPVGRLCWLGAPSHCPNTS